MGDCHYLYGNHMTVKRMRYLQELLAVLGLEGRLHLEWISSAEAQKFVQVVTEFTDKIKALGQSPLSIFTEKTKTQAPKPLKDYDAKNNSNGPGILYKPLRNVIGL